MIADTLKRIQTEGGSGNFAIFETDTYYTQFTGESGKSELYAEAVSNAYLPRNDALSMEQITQLQLMGWNLDDGSNFYRTWNATTDADRAHIAQEVMRAFGIYGVNSESDLTFSLELG